MSGSRDEIAHQYRDQYGVQFNGEPVKQRGEPVHTSGKRSEGQSR